MLRLAILTSHPIQYHAPLFREIARRLDVVVFFAHKASPEQQAAAGFGTTFDWDVDLLSGYEHEFLRNVAPAPGTHHFAGCDTPKIGEKLSSGRFDALLVTGWHLKCYWQGLWAAKNRGVPVMVRGDSHLGTPRALGTRAIKRLVYPPLLRLFDAALYVGKRNFEYWRHYHYPAHRLFFSPHCVDTSYFASRATQQARGALRARLGIGAHARTALFAGKLIPLKRPQDLVKAAGLIRLRGADLHALIAGSGALEGALRERARQENVAIHFLGFQNQSEMPAAYAASDVVVLPSEQETWGLVANEALACSRPIVVSDAVGCAPDLATDMRVGRTFPLGRVDMLAAALTDTLSLAPEERAFAAINERYSVGAAAAAVEDACRFLIQRKEPTSR